MPAQEKPSGTKVTSKPAKPKTRRPAAKKKASAQPKRCRTVTKKVKGKKRKVRVCSPRKTTGTKKKTPSKKKAPKFVLAPPAGTVIPQEPVPAAPPMSPVPDLPPSPAVPVAPDPPEPDVERPQAVEGPLSARQAERLLWRAGFGPRPGQIAAFTGKDARAAVLELTRPAGVTLSGPAPTDSSGWPLNPIDIWGHDHVVWLDRMVRVDQPLTERIALIFHDWFGVSRGNVSAPMIQDHIQLYRQKGLGSFDELLRAVTIDPAMLVFLDGISNRKGRVNENYGREVMELFTLGADRGAYTETDIREAAKALTGWRADWDTFLGSADWRYFRFDQTRHVTGAKTIFGQTGDWGWEDVVRLCLEHPLHASFFCTKMWSYFVPVAPDEQTLARLIGIYLATGRQIRPVIEAILQHPACLDGPAMVMPPVVYAAGLLRAVGSYIRTDGWSWLCDIAGQQLYWPPNVSGWEDRRWLDSSTMRGRWHIARQALKQSYIDPWPGRPPDYDVNETPEQAVAKAIAHLGSPTLSAETRAEMLAFATVVETKIPRPGDRPFYKASRQNALRMLVATSPDRQIS